MKAGSLNVLSRRRSLSLFLALLACLAGWQLWLTWRLMEQDHSLEQQQNRDRLEQTADLAVAQLARSLGDWDLGLREINSLPPSAPLAKRFPTGVTFLLISRGVVKAYPARPLLFVPDPPAPTTTPRVFDEADALELREQQYERATAALQPLIANPQTRAEALLRMARMERKRGKTDAALATYKRLATETNLGPSGVPYALVAANSRCRVLTGLGRREQAAAEARSLRAGLLEGRWPLRREVFEYYWSELAGFGLPAADPPQEAMSFAALASMLFERWQGSMRPGASEGGREQQADGSLLLWDASKERVAAMVTPAGWLNASLRLSANSNGVRWRLLAPGVQATAGSPTRPLAEVQLPGRLELVTAASNSTPNRRTLWLAGAVLMVLLILASGYAAHRGISHELRVARLQSDFVSAVSHEFRSPLTTLRTITELLAHNRITDEARRRQSYLFLDRETNRLHQLVEDLLDFGRMESGRKQYRIEACDAFQLVRAAVADFSEGAAANDFHVETNLESSPALVRADEEAFRRALRNLLENAMKYSPDCRTAWVDGAVTDHRVSISVRDKGMGIDPREQRAIFQKFVRGDAAKKAGIKGTGIGLSMVQQILEALGGEIRLQSNVGAGSTFTIVLPLAEE